MECEHVWILCRGMSVRTCNLLKVVLYDPCVPVLFQDLGDLALVLLLAKGVLVNDLAVACSVKEAWCDPWLKDEPLGAGQLPSEQDKVKNSRLRD